MKVLLLNVPIAFNEWQNLEMPLGIAYIASVLEKNGHEVFVKDYEVEKLNENEMKKEFNNIDPHIVGISFRSSSYGSAKIISSILKEINRNIPIVLGGHHATAFPEETLNDIESDFIIRGEAESTIVRLVEGLEGKRRLESIKGIVYKSNRDVIQNGTSDDIEELDLLPFPA